jgi:hypothetical protein
MVREDERSSEPVTSLASRLTYAMGPIAGGLIIDAVDLATFGPAGLVLGFALGGLIGYWIASGYDFSLRKRIIIALAAGVYCTVPATEVLPLATLLGVATRFSSGPKALASADD